MSGNSGVDAVGKVVVEPIDVYVCRVGGRCVQQPCAVWVRCLCCASASMGDADERRRTSHPGQLARHGRQAGTQTACDERRSEEAARCIPWELSWIGIG